MPYLLLYRIRAAHTSLDTLKSIGFLFNHDATHQVAHIAPIIAAFRQHYPKIKVTALVSSDEQLALVDDIAGCPADGGIDRIELRTPPPLAQLFKFFNALLPAQRLYVLKRYKQLFESFDCLVVPEMTSSRLKTRLGLSTTPLVLVPHGAGYRSIGFCNEIKQYDYVLLSGPKVRNRMLAAGLIRADNHCLVGYPKFDSVALERRAALFNNDRPTVLYNPHCEPKLSSWYAMGDDVLAFFADNPDYNLVVAPHVMLFKKRVHISLESRCVRLAKQAAEKYRKCPNIMIDQGSASSVNMKYTLNADIYLGDVSSQVYEFIQRPRPCVFLNSHAADWRHNENYKHWNFGPVIERVADLRSILAGLEATHLPYAEIQRRGFSETFDLSETPSSVRAARAIIDFLDTRKSLAG